MFFYISISIKITPKLTLIVRDNDGATDNDTAYTLGEGKGWKCWTKGIGFL